MADREIYLDIEMYTNHSCTHRVNGPSLLDVQMGSRYFADLYLISHSGPEDDTRRR